MVLGCDAIARAFLRRYQDLSAQPIVAETGNTAVISRGLLHERVV